MVSSLRTLCSLGMNLLLLPKQEVRNLIGIGVAGHTKVTKSPSQRTNREENERQRR